MRTLTAAQLVEAAKSGVEPVLLGTLTFTAPTTLRVYLADRYVPGAHPDLDWLAYVQSWGAIREALHVLADGGVPATAEVVLFNNRPVAGRARFSDLMRTVGNTADAWEFGGAILDVSLRLGDAEPLTLGRFYVEEPTEISDRVLGLRLSDQSLLLADELPVTTITRERFPQAILVGVTIPRPFGRLTWETTRAPGRPVVDGAATILNGAIDDAVAEILLADASRMPDAGTGLVKGAEFVTWTGRAGHRLTGVTRGALSTTAVSHTDGAAFLHCRTDEYVYVFGEGSSRFPIKALPRVYVNDQLLSGATLSADDPNIAGGRRFASARFPVTDVAAFHLRQHTLLAAALPGSQNSTAPASAHIHAVTMPTLVPTTAGAPTYEHQVTVRATRTGGTPATEVYAQYLPLSGGYVKLGDIPDDGTDITFTFRLDGYRATQNIRIFWAGIGAGSMTTVVREPYVISPEGRAGGGGDSTAGAIIGEVTADLDGLQDDEVGSISGTPRALLEVPHDVAQAFLRLCPSFNPETDLGAHWPATRLQQVNAGLRWALLLGFDGPVSLEDLRANLEAQARSELAVEAGLWELRYIGDPPAAADLTLDYLTDVSEAAPAVLSRTARTERANVIVASGQRDYVEGRERYSKEAADLSQPGFTHRVERRQVYDYVQEPAVVDHLAAWRLGWVKRQRWQVNVVATQEALGLEKGDHIAFTNHPVLAAHGGAAVLFRVKEKAYLLDDDYPLRIRLTAVEAAA